MSKFRKKPVVIEARQFLGGGAGPNGSPNPDGTSSTHAVYQWIERNTLGSFEPLDVIEGRKPWPESGVTIDPRDGRMIIATLEGGHWVNLFDYVIRGVQGEFYPCKPDIFEATYEAVEGECAENGVNLIAAERQRQIDVEGYDVGHDSVHSSDALTQAAVCYATPAHMRLALAGRAPLGWPWGVSHWKPTPDDRVRELVKAGALIAAEIDRLNYRAGEGRG